MREINIGVVGAGIVGLAVEYHLVESGAHVTLIDRDPLGNAGGIAVTEVVPASAPGYAFGHGHLGLTQAATTGRLIGSLIFRRPSPVDLSPYAVDRFN